MVHVCVVLGKARSHLQRQGRIIAEPDVELRKTLREFRFCFGLNRSDLHAVGLKRHFGSVGERMDHLVELVGHHAHPLNALLLHLNARASSLLLSFFALIMGQLGL